MPSDRAAGGDGHLFAPLARGKIIADCKVPRPFHPARFATGKVKRVSSTGWCASYARKE
jgi:hypothetical protein